MVPVVLIGIGIVRTARAGPSGGSFRLRTGAPPVRSLFTLLIGRMNAGMSEPRTCSPVGSAA